MGSYAARNRNAANIALALVYAVFILIESSGPGVNDYAHIFGVAGGFALGLLFTRMRPPEVTSGGDRQLVPIREQSGWTDA